LPFCFCPLAVFGIIFDALANCLSTDRTNVSVLIMVNDGWDLGTSASFFLGRITKTLMSDTIDFDTILETNLPSYTPDFRNIAWFENATPEVRYHSRKLLQFN
jgi:hypothetical protein